MICYQNKPLLHSWVTTVGNFCFAVQSINIPAAMVDVSKAEHLPLHFVSCSSCPLFSPFTSRLAFLSTQIPADYFSKALLFRLACQVRQSCSESAEELLCGQSGECSTVICSLGITGESPLLSFFSLGRKRACSVPATLFLPEPNFLGFLSVSLMMIGFLRYYCWSLLTQGSSCFKFFCSIAAMPLYRYSHGEEGLV